MSGSPDLHWAGPLAGSGQLRDRRWAGIRISQAAPPGLHLSCSHYSINAVNEVARTYDSPLREEQALATRARIVGALCDLLVEERPSRISISAVARRAGVSVRSVYNHFPTKDDLFDAIEPYVRHEVRGQLLSDAEILGTDADIVELMRRELPGLARNAQLLTALVRAGIDDDERSKARRLERLDHLTAALSRQIPQLDTVECGRLATLVAGIGSWATAQTMTQAGLEVDEVAGLLAWTAQLVIERAARDGRVGHPSTSGGKQMEREGTQ